MTEIVDHRRLLASLSADERVALTAKADAPGLIRLATHLGAIAALGAAIVAAVPFWPLLLLPQGILIVFLFTALHECVHRTPFRTDRLNTGVAALCGFAVLLPPIWFRYFHLAHHRHTHDPEHDPELLSGKPETLADYLRYASGIPVWIFHIRTIFKNALGRCDDVYVPAGGHDKVRREARIMLAAYLALAGLSVWAQSTLLLFVWVVPALLGQPFLRLYLLAEHGRCPHVANMFENTRTTFTNRLVRWIAWNMPYHAEHHAYPTVPFHKLPAFHAIARDHLRVTERGYARFHARYVADL